MMAFSSTIQGLPLILFLVGSIDFKLADFKIKSVLFLIIKSAG